MGVFDRALGRSEERRVSPRVLRRAFRSIRSSLTSSIIRLVLQSDFSTTQLLIPYAAARSQDLCGIDRTGPECPNDGPYLLLRSEY